MSRFFTFGAFTRQKEERKMVLRFLFWFSVKDIMDPLVSFPSSVGMGKRNDLTMCPRYFLLNHMDVCHYLERQSMLELWYYEQT